MLLDETFQASNVVLRGKRSQIALLRQRSQVGPLRQRSQIGLLRQRSQIGLLRQRSEIGLLGQRSQIGLLRRQRSQICLYPFIRGRKSTPKLTIRVGATMSLSSLTVGALYDPRPPSDCSRNTRPARDVAISGGIVTSTAGWSTWRASGLAARLGQVSSCRARTALSRNNWR